MDLPEVRGKLKILPDKEIKKELSEIPKPLEIAIDMKEPLKDDDLFLSHDKPKKSDDNEKDIHSEDLEQIVETKEEPEQVLEQKPTKKVKKKRKPLSKAHREALARGRAKALENRRKKAQIRKKLKQEKKQEKDKEVQYKYERFQKEKKLKEIERKNILLNETIDLNSVGKFFDLMDKYEKLKTARKENYYKKKLELKQQKYKQNQTKIQHRQKPIIQRQQETTTKPKLKYGHLWN